MLRAQRAASPPKTHSTSSRTMFGWNNIQVKCCDPISTAHTARKAIVWKLKHVQQSERKWIWGVVKFFYCTIHQWEINHRKSIKVKYAFDSTARWESRERAEHSWNHKVDIETLQYALECDAVVDGVRESRSSWRANKYSKPFVESYGSRCVTKNPNCPLWRFVTVVVVFCRSKGFPNWNV